MEIETLPTFNLAQDPSLTDENLYRDIKKLETEIDYLEIQEDFIKEEQLNLKREILRAQEEIKRIQATPLAVGQFIEMIDLHHGNIRILEKFTWGRGGSKDFWPCSKANSP
jgi:26S proteasome regulatory subunit T3